MMGETFRSYLEENKLKPGLVSILLDLAKVFPELAGILRNSQKGYLQSQNVYGEKQLAIDVQSNNLFLDVLKKNKYVASLASEELENEEHGAGFVAGAENGQDLEVDSSVKDLYSLAFDPLDGSSLVDVNLAVGSIFGIYEGQGFLGRKGSEQVAALIVVYGPRLSFVFSCGQGTVEFIFDEKLQEFILSAELHLAEEKKMFAPGNLRACSSEKWYLKLLEYWVMNGYTLRYSGGMVPDVNQILLKSGGVFVYPGYSEQPDGKLRLLYECAPMAFLTEQAGGVAMTRSAEDKKASRLLDLEVKKLDQRTPIFLGSKKEVELVLAMMEGT